MSTLREIGRDPLESASASTLHGPTFHATLHSYRARPCRVCALTPTLLEILAEADGTPAVPVVTRLDPPGCTRSSRSPRSAAGDPQAWPGLEHVVERAAQRRAAFAASAGLRRIGNLLYGPLGAGHLTRLRTYVEIVQVPTDVPQLTADLVVAYWQLRGTSDQGADGDWELAAAITH